MSDMESLADVRALARRILAGKPVDAGDCIDALRGIPAWARKDDPGAIVVLDWLQTLDHWPGGDPEEVLRKRGAFPQGGSK